MKTNKKLVKLILSSIISVFLFSCSNNLSRDKAKEQIIQKYKLPYEITRDINLSAQTTSKFRNSSKDAHNIPTKQGVMINLENEGLITYTIERTSSNIEEMWYENGSPNVFFTEKNPPWIANWRQHSTRIYKIAETYQHSGNLTEKGRQYLVNGNNFKLANRVFGEITGIVERKDLNISEVTYTEKITDITPFGKVLGINEEIIDRTVTFTKYDDGWRLGN